MCGERPLPSRFSADVSALLVLLLGLVSVLGVTGCVAVPSNRSVVTSINLNGNDAIDSAELREKLAMSESPRFLGLFQGLVYDYRVFDRFVLERDLQRIERYYRARGYYQARVRAGRVFFVTRNKVRVEIEIEEGPKMRVARVDFHGLQAVAEEPWVKSTEDRISRLLCGRGRCQDQASRQPFEEERFVKAGQLLQRALEDNGYAYAKVERTADVDLPQARAAVGYFATLGPKLKFGEVTIVGLGNLPEAPVRRAVDIQRGAPYSRDELALAERAVLDLNVFSSVVVTPDLSGRTSSQPGAEVPILVTVEPAKLKAIHVGAGAQVDSIQSDLHLVSGWEHRNLFGGLRSLSFEIKPGVVLYPTRFPTFKTPQNFLPEGRFNAQFRQPGFLEARTGLFTRLDGSIAPVILSPDDVSGNVLGYRDIRMSAGLDRSFNRIRLYAALSPTVQFDSPFAYLGTLNPHLKSVVIVYPELAFTFDFRDQPVHPHAGAYLNTDLQWAGFAGSARDVKAQTELRGYLPVLRKWTLAGRVRAGLLFAQNYGGTIESTANGSPPPESDASVRDTQLMFLRGFFAGGLGSDRGYALREIGPHGVVPQGSSTLAKCAAGGVSRATCDLPLGGFTLWEASLEVRFPISGPFTGALFTDMADVSDRKLNFRFDRPHLSLGLGFRYDTPVGPIRFDAGYRVPGLQAPLNAADEGTPESTFGLPIALSFGIGEAF